MLDTALGIKALMVAIFKSFGVGSVDFVSALLRILSKSADCRSFAEGEEECNFVGDDEADKGMISFLMEAIFAEFKGICVCLFSSGTLPMVPVHSSNRDSNSRRLPDTASAADGEGKSIEMDGTLASPTSAMLDDNV